MAGAKVTAQDIDGNEVTFKVPVGSSSGTEVRISGRGVANRQGDGDLIGRVQIRIPDKPSLKVKHAAKEFDKECAISLDELAKERAGLPWHAHPGPPSLRRGRPKCCTTCAQW